MLACHVTYFTYLFNTDILQYYCCCYEVFDAAIIVASFTLDLIFVEGITGVQGEETLAFIIIFLLWRVLRVINGNAHTVHSTTSYVYCVAV